MWGKKTFERMLANWRCTNYNTINPSKKSWRKRPESLKHCLKCGDKRQGRAM